ncbi:hypothetical protein B0H14DRAFT_3486953 [Mycena olivaceomarginata]|nr:hypothetical protein B0H14DRAFT_3486953 [Mycena olivaceomarginata]
MLVKLDSIHLLIEWQFQSPGRLREAMKSDDKGANWRIEPIGYDANSNAYSLLGADRLWIHRIHPEERNVPQESAESEDPDLPMPDPE